MDERSDNERRIWNQFSNQLFGSAILVRLVLASLPPVSVSLLHHRRRPHSFPRHGVACYTDFGNSLTIFRWFRQLRGSGKGELPLQLLKRRDNRLTTSSTSRSIFIGIFRKREIDANRKRKREGEGAGGASRCSP